MSMERFALPLLPSLAILLAGVALVGYLLGDNRSGTTAAKPRIAAGSGILLEYPAGWHPAADAPPIPGLAIDGLLALAPGGHAAAAGLLSGRLPADQPAPLPAGFVGLMRGLPRSDVVNLASGQAYRYRQLHLPGYGRALELYVIPNAVEGPSVLACYASSESTPFMQRCEQTVAQVALPGQSLYSLSPQAPYASQLGRLIATLDSQRLRLRREMRERATPVQAAALATALAARFAAAAAAIRTLEPPQAAGPAQAALANSLLNAHRAYERLAQAAARSAAVASSEAIDEARARISSAEAEVDSALENYALLGYGQM
jgi:hypothetical protein